MTALSVLNVNLTATFPLTTSSVSPCLNCLNRSNSSSVFAEALPVAPSRRGTTALVCKRMTSSVFVLAAAPWIKSSL